MKSNVWHVLYFDSIMSIFLFYSKHTHTYTCTLYMCISVSAIFLTYAISLFAVNSHLLIRVSFTFNANHCSPQLLLSYINAVVTVIFDCWDIRRDNNLVILHFQYNDLLCAGKISIYCFASFFFPFGGIKLRFSK